MALVQDRPLHLPCRLMAVRTPSDEAGLLIGLGQVLERAFHLAARCIEAIIKRFAGRFGLGTKRYDRALRVAVPVLNLLAMGGMLVVINDWLREIQGRLWWEVPFLAVGFPGHVFAAAGITLIVAWALAGLALSVLAGREAFALSGITGVDAEPLPFAQPESLMTLVIDVKAGRKQTAGLNHSLHEVRRIRLRIACWIRSFLSCSKSTSESEITGFETSEKRRKNLRVERVCR